MSLVLEKNRGLPEDWIHVKLSDIAQIKSGGTPSTSKKEYWDGSIPWINSGKLKDSLITEPSRFITKEGLDNSAAKLFPENTTVIALTGATTSKVGYLTFSSSTNQSVTGILPNEFFDSKFIFYSLINERRQILSHKIGSAQHHINQRIVENIIIPFCPLNEQKRIVAKIEELFLIIETTKKHQQTLSLKLKQFEQCLLSNIYTEKFPLKLLEDVCIKITDGTHNPPKFQNTGIPFIFVSNIVNGELSLETKKFITKNDYELLSKRCPIEFGDVLYSTVGSYGVAVKVNTSERFQFQRHISLLKPNSLHIDTQYLVYVLNSSQVLSQAHKLARGIAQKTLNLSDLRKFSIPVPPLREQHRISEKISSSFSIIMNQKNIIEKCLQQLEILKKIILKQAFEGKLIPQDPNDEPASALLERIKQDKGKIIISNTTKQRRIKNAK